MNFDEAEDDVLVRGVFHKNAPAWAVLPAVANADAQYRYQSGVTSGAMYDLYNRAMKGYKDARPGSAHMAYDRAEFKEVDGTEYMLWLGYTWIVNGGVDTPAADVDWQTDPANDFTEATVGKLNRTYLGVTNALVVNPYTAYLADTICTQANSAVLANKVNIITEQSDIPSESTAVFAGLRLKPLDLDRPITKEERLAIAQDAGEYRQITTEDGNTYYVNEKNEIISDEYGNLLEGYDEYVYRDYCVPLTSYTPNAEAAAYLTGDPFNIVFETEYPPCEGDGSGETLLQQLDHSLQPCLCAVYPGLRSEQQLRCHRSERSQLLYIC